MNFQGRSLALSAAAIAEVAESLDVLPAHVWTILSVETEGCGFWSDRRPAILYEQHIFSHLTGGAYDESYSDISSKDHGNYGGSHDHQYARLARAMQADESAALKATSWGLGQVMGANFNMFGDASVHAMVNDAIDSEDAQLRHVREYIAKLGLDRALLGQDWHAFAAGYNGPKYLANDYQIKLMNAFSRMTAELPDVNVRAAQLYLMFQGYSVGPIDGILGDRTRMAIRRWQAVRHKSETGAVTPDLVQELREVVDVQG